MADSIGKSKLAVGILNSMDIANNITYALQYLEDDKRTRELMSKNNDAVAQTLKQAQTLTKMGLKSGYSIVSETLKELPPLLNNMLQMKYFQLNQGASGYKMTASMQADLNHVYSQQQFIDLKSSIVFDMPEAYIRDKVQKFYNSVYRQADMSLNSIISQKNRAMLNDSEYKQRMIEKGIPDADFKYYEDETENYPNISAFIRYASLMPFTDDTVRWLCKVNNITKTPVIDYYINLLHALRLRDEYAQYLQYLRADYQDGLIDDETYSEECENHYVSPEEAEASLANMQYTYERTLTRNEIQSQCFLYRKGTMAILAEIAEENTEDFFYERLTALGVKATMANSIVRLEASKFGIEWERE